MSCASYFEDLRRQARARYSFNNQVLQEIEELKDRLARKLESLRVNGDFRKDNHRIQQIEAELSRLEKTEASMKRLLEA